MRYAWRLLGSLSIVLVLSAAAAADDFRVETKIFAAKGKAPVSQNTTLFRAGYVYDYLSSPEQVAVFDQPHGRFIVLDPKRKVKAEIKTDDVLLFASKFQTIAAMSSNPFTKFAADPDFEVDFGQNGELTLSSQHMTYRLQTVPANTPEAAQQYREFCDWYARFNAMSNPGATPPFARMAVNAELAKRGLIPAEVQLTVPAQSGVKAVSLRSEHHVSWRLLPRDIDRIDVTANQLATFRKIDFDELEPPSVTKK